jgi:hypothetical protein
MTTRRTAEQIRLRIEAREQRERSELFRWAQLASRAAGEMTPQDVQFMATSFGMCAADAGALAAEYAAEQSADRMTR